MRNNVENIEWTVIDKGAEKGLYQGMALVRLYDPNAVWSHNMKQAPAWKIVAWDRKGKSITGGPFKTAHEIDVFIERVSDYAQDGVFTTRDLMSVGGRLTYAIQQEVGSR